MLDTPVKAPGIHRTQRQKVCVLFTLDKLKGKSCNQAHSAWGNAAGSWLCFGVIPDCCSNGNRLISSPKQKRAEERYPYCFNEEVSHGLCWRNVLQPHTVLCSSSLLIHLLHLHCSSAAVLFVVSNARGWFSPFLMHTAGRWPVLTWSPQSIRWWIEVWQSAPSPASELGGEGLQGMRVVF